MAKFSKGDKVESVKTGAKGVVDEVYGDEKYAVLFDGATNPDRVEGFQIKAANGCARNAKFKIGDKVIWTQFGGKPMQIVDMNDKGEYLCRTHDGNEVVFSEEKLKIANSASVRSANAVVQNAINARRARNADVGKALMDAISACRKLAETARKEGNEEERQRAIKAGTALYGMKPSW